MAKRFTDTNKYKKPFIRGLQGAYKLLWDYLYHDCDHAGIWIVDFEIAQIYLGADMLVNRADALKFFNSDETRIHEFDNGEKWFIPSFVFFQYGELKDTNRAHVSVIDILTKKGLISTLQGVKDKDKDKGMDKDKDKDKESELDVWPTFEDFWSAYDKKIDREKSESIWRKINQSDKIIMMDSVTDYVLSTPNKEYRKNPVTYLRNESWKNEIIVNNNKNGKTNRLTEEQQQYLAARTDI